MRVLVSPDARPPDVAAGALLAGTDGVEEVTAVRRLTVDVGRAVMGGSLYAMDLAAAERLLTSPPEAPAPGWASLAATLEGHRPAVGIPLAERVRRLALVVDSAIVADPEASPPNDVSADHRGLLPSALVMDGLGSVVLLEGEPGALVGDGQRLTIPLIVTSGGQDLPLVAPLRLLAVELTPQGPGQTTSVPYSSVRPERVRTVPAAGSTAAALSRIHTQSLGTTSAIGRSRSAIAASPAAT